MNCSRCGKPIEDLQPYFMVNDQVWCYECKHKPEPEVKDGD